MKLLNKHTFFCSGISLCLLSQPLVAFAEGALTPASAGFGANRRIKTVANYQGARGYFTIPTFSIPVEYSLNGTVPDVNRPKYNPILTNYLVDQITIVDNGPDINAPDGISDILAAYMDKATDEGWVVETSNHSNPNDSKPTFYMGSSSGGLEVDAGVQWEWMPLYGYAPGWAAVISHNNSYSSPRVAQPNSSQLGAYRAGSGTPNPTVSQYQMQYGIEEDGIVRLILVPSVYSGAAEFNAGGVNFTWNNTPVYYANPATKAAAKAAMQIKRVVGITQKGGPNTPDDVFAGDADQLDGSWMRGCTFSSGEIKNATGWQQWNAVRTDNATANATGYAPGRFNAVGGVVNNVANQPINDKDNGNPRLYKVDFPEITNPALTELQVRTTLHNQPGDGSRYSQERVDINLRYGGAVTGVSIRPARYQYNTPPSAW